MSYWIFKANPDIYRLDDRLTDPEPTNSWRVKQHKDEIQEGDIAFIWRTGRNRGIRAVMRVDSGPEETNEIDTEQKYLVERDTLIRRRVEGTLTHRFPCISYRELGIFLALRTYQFSLSVFFNQGPTLELPMTKAKYYSRSRMRVHDPALHIPLNETPNKSLDASGGSVFRN